MAIINCTDKNCIYQKDGKCECNAVTASRVKANGHCVYFIPLSNKKDTFHAAENTPDRLV